LLIHPHLNPPPSRGRKKEKINLPSRGRKSSFPLDGERLG